MTTTRAAAEPAARRVEGFIDKFDPAIAKLVRAARRALRKRFPTAVELVYDNYNALAIGFGPSERTSTAFVSLAVFARGVNLYFINGATLPDPEKRLQGGGNRGRFVRLESLDALDDPYVVRLLETAADQDEAPLPKAGRGYTVVKSVSAKQRPRRPIERPTAGTRKAVPKTNARWHAAHRMPSHPSLDQRVTWHVAHATHCACRPMPATVVAELKRRDRLGR
jgi:Domain of unknown function (DU1801)